MEAIWWIVAVASVLGSTCGQCSAIGVPVTLSIFQFSGTKLCNMQTHSIRNLLQLSLANLGGNGPKPFAQFLLGLEKTLGGNSGIILRWLEQQPLKNGKLVWLHIRRAR